MIYETVRSDLDIIVTQTISLQNMKYPELFQVKATISQEEINLGMHYCLLQLIEAVLCDKTILFTEYVKWVKSIMYSIGISRQELIINLECSFTIMQQLYPKEYVNVINPYINMAIDQLSNVEFDYPSYLKKDNPYFELMQQYLEAATEGNKRRATELITNAVTSGVNIQDIYINVFQPVQYEVGRLWQMGKLTVAQEHYITALTQVIMSHLYQYIFNNNTTKKLYRFVGTCVSNEIHEMGIRMVADLLEENGWDTHYLGANLSVDEIIKLVDQLKPTVIGLSASTTINISSVELVIREITRHFGKDRAYIIVGGYPFNLVPDLWKSIGADGYSKDAREAVALCNRLMYRR